MMTVVGADVVAGQNSGLRAGGGGGMVRNAKCGKPINGKDDDDFEEFR